MANSVCQYGRSETRTRVMMQTSQLSQLQSPWRDVRHHVLIRVPQLHNLEVHGEVAHIAARVRARSVGKRDTRVLEALKYDLEQFSLLGIHVSCLEIVDAEKAILELANVFFQKIAALHRHATRTVHALRVIKAPDIEP